MKKGYSPNLCLSTLLLDPEVKKLVDVWVSPLRRDMKVVKGHTRVPLLPSNFAEHEYESNLGNLIADAIVDNVHT